MKKALYPGSFDPPTLGHLDIIRRASMLFDTLLIGIAKNSEKKPMLTIEKRVEFLKRIAKPFSNVEIVVIEGLTTDFAKKENVSCLIRCIRSSLDYEHELSLAHMNHSLSEIETLFISANPNYSHIDSTKIKEIISQKGPIKSFVPDTIEKELY